MRPTPHSTRQWIYCLYFISMLHFVLINCKQRSNESGDLLSSGESTIFMVVLLSLRSVFVVCVCACVRYETIDWGTCTVDTVKGRGKQVWKCFAVVRMRAVLIYRTSECNLCIRERGCCGIAMKVSGWLKFQVCRMYKMSVGSCQRYSVVLWRCTLGSWSLLYHHGDWQQGIKLKHETSFIVLGRKNMKNWRLKYKDIMAIHGSA